jgi:L-fucose mutarotase
MLKGIPPILGPDLLYILRAMGHGDEIAIVDANYPGDSAGPQLVRLDGISASEVLDAILTVMPLDTFVDEQAFGMEVVGDAKKREETHKEFAKLIKKHEPGMKLSLLERFAFYERVHGAYAVVQTGERRLYGNVLLKKGIVRPE